VDENFLCSSPILGATNWEESSEHSNEDLSAGNSDEKLFSLLSCTPDLPMIIPLAGMPGTKQSSLPTQSSYVDAVDADSTGVETVTEATGPEPVGSKGNFDLVSIEGKDTALILAAPTSTDAPFPSATDNEIPASSSVTQPESGSLFSSETALAVSRPRQSSLSSSIHTCSTCHLYAPSSSATFYLDAWLNQQKDIHPSSVSECKTKSKKRVNWPDTTAELRSIIVVDKWIEKGLHVHQPRRHGDSDSDEDDEPECQQSKACEREEERVNLPSRGGYEVIKVVPEVQLQTQQQAQTSQSPTVRSLKHPYCDSVGSSASLRLNADSAARKQEMITSPTRSTPVSRAPVQVQRKTEALVVKRPSPPSSVSSSSSSTTSLVKSQQQRMAKHFNPASLTSNQSSAPPVVTQLPAPKKKFSSGVTVKIIGGPYSEHEAAMKIRGVDPIKHRAMIENYWQF